MDIKHNYIEKGQGEPIILIHGNSSNCEYFVNQIEEFSKEYHVYALDTRGHGKTPRGTKPLTINQFAIDLLGFMDEKNIDKAHILGFSDGANTAMVFAMKYPERVNRLILNAGNLYFDGISKRAQLFVKSLYAISKIILPSQSEIIELMITEPNLKPEDLSKIQAKTLVIVGSKDEIKKEHSELIAKSISNSKLVFIHGSNMNPLHNGTHFIACQNPKEYNKEVLTFLKE
ncbi:hypothetical protein PIROE2DRAFT_18609 [Piromyces sp. E2]|nr:hypothetical protein PIROE2DRAFT_18609 [Piromyces sp. E2]|eukprot:OUM56671.1 hypothetical protein PIROE2DRAFT_18609 [Piromyces sp. E2]